LRRCPWPSFWISNAKLESDRSFHCCADLTSLAIDTTPIHLEGHISNSLSVLTRPRYSNVDGPAGPPTTLRFRTLSIHTLQHHHDRKTSERDRALRVSIAAHSTSTDEEVDDKRNPTAILPRMLRGDRARLNRKTFILEEPWAYSICFCRERDWHRFDSYPSSLSPSIHPLLHLQNFAEPPLVFSASSPLAQIICVGSSCHMRSLLQTGSLRGKYTTFLVLLRLRTGVSSDTIISLTFLAAAVFLLKDTL
jgi:hypothetical protein